MSVFLALLGSGVCWLVTMILLVWLVDDIVHSVREE